MPLEFDIRTPEGRRHAAASTWTEEEWEAAERSVITFKHSRILPKPSGAVPIPPDENPLKEALRLTEGARMEAYGHPVHNFRNIATGWGVIVDASVSPEQVALMMIWLKICRENNVPAFDNEVDMAGYVNTLHMVKERT